MHGRNIHHSPSTGTPNGFLAYKARFVNAIRGVMAVERGGRLDPVLGEAAFPAYADPNPLVRYLFWERIRRTMRHIGDERLGVVVDFGCGGGVMLPFLALRAERIVAVDTDLTPLNRIKATGLIPSSIECIEGDERAAHAAVAGADLVLALDVLEHVADLSATLRSLCSMLAPHGRIIVSGPTENALYRVGRRLAGAAYTGGYHHRGVAEIRRALARSADVRGVATLFPGLPFFELFEGRPRG